MRPEERDAAYLWDMLEAAREVQQMIGGSAVDDFLKNRVLMRATERTVEIIGEAAGRISDGFKEAHPEVPWRQIKGQRNILAHEYGQIDHQLLFKTATIDVPALIARLERLLPPIEDE